MLEISPLRKNKIHLEDYDYQKDILNRLFLKSLSSLDIEVLEEILYSPLKISLHKMATNLDQDEATLKQLLQKFETTSLIKIEDEQIVIDKEVRKYFELEAMKFDEDFKPDMEYLYGILRKIPIHVLPIWYSIPRTSNNIFQSIIDKFLLTPQIYQRYQMEIGYSDPVLIGIMEDLYESEDLRLLGSEIEEKYDLSPEKFQEYLLYLEFDFIATLGYVKMGEGWEAVITPFHEWKEYIRHIRSSNPDPIENSSQIERTRPSNFAFIEDISKLLQALQEKELSLKETTTLLRIIRSDSESYLERLLKKMEKIGLIKIGDTLKLMESAKEWLEMSLETRALYLYRHPFNQLLSFDGSYNEKAQKEAEKGIKLVIDHGWVSFDDFMKGSMIALNDDQKVFLEKRGKGWKYKVPTYTEEEVSFIRSALFEGLFEVGMVATGKLQDRECFVVTPFGQTFFGS